MGNKLDHLRYWRGVLKYRLTHPDAYRELWEKLNESLDITRLHGMRLGAYRQHDPQPPYRELFPVRDQKGEAGLSFAIVTPSFNQRAFVGQTIASVLGQNYPRLQYAVIDGGSRDGSQEEIEKHA